MNEKPSNDTGNGEIRKGQEPNDPSAPGGVVSDAAATPQRARTKAEASRVFVKAPANIAKMSREEIEAFARMVWLSAVEQMRPSDPTDGDKGTSGS